MPNLSHEGKYLDLDEANNDIEWLRNNMNDFHNLWILSHNFINELKYNIEKFLPIWEKECNFIFTERQRWFLINYIDKIIKAHHREIIKKAIWFPNELENN